MRFTPSLLTFLATAVTAVAAPAQPQAFLDKQSVSPGEVVRVHVSTTAANCSAKVLQSLGFGSSVELLSSGPLPGLVQQVSPGSYAWTPSTPGLELGGVMSLEAWIYPTHRSGTDTYAILTKYRLPDRISYGLFLTPGGRVAFHLSRTGRPSEGDALLSTVIVPLHQWTHVIATYNGETRRIFINRVNDVSQSWTGPIFKSNEPVRVAASGNAGRPVRHFNGMIDCPTIFDRALFAGEIEQRFAGRANYTPAEPGLLPFTLAQWNFGEEDGTVLRDATPNRHDLTLVNYGTRGVAGPSPRNATRKSHLIRFAQDDLFNPAWTPTWSFTVPATWTAGFYMVEVQDGSGSAKLPLIVKPTPSARADIAVLASTNTWHGYNGWAGDLQSTHLDGTIRYYVGTRQPNPGAQADLQTPGSGYSHLTDAERYLWEWLHQNGYPFDLYSDADLHVSSTLLDPYDVLIINGHSQYWTHEMVDRVEAFLARGGSLINLSGNTMWSLVTFNSDLTVMESREHPHRAGTIPASERWHSQAGGVLGGTLRCLGRPEHRVLGTGYGIGFNNGAFGIYEVLAPGHWAFAGTGVTAGRPFGFQSLNGNAILGHAADVVVPEWSPTNVEVLAVGVFLPASELLTFNCQTRNLRSRSSGSEMIHFEHPGGGGVFGAPSVAFGGSLAVDPVASGVLRNVLDRFLGR